MILDPVAFSGAGFDPRGDFLWATGMEDTFVPQVKRGHRPLDEYALVGHYTHWREDLALAAGIGVQALRVGIPWYRVEPTRGEFDWGWTDGLLSHIVHDLKLLPIVDLVHYGCPLWLEREFANEHYPEAVASYATAFAKRYRDLVSWYTPVNEPLMNSLWCGRRGLWPPYLRGDRGYVRVMLQLAKGMVRTIHSVKRIDPAAIMVHVEAAGLVRTALPELASLASDERDQIFLSYDLTTGRVTPTHPLHGWLVRNGASLDDLEFLRRHAVPLDVVGLNFYPQWSTVELYADRSGKMRSRPVEKDGVGFGELLTYAYNRYGVPVLVTETSARGRSSARSRWLRESIAAVKRVRGQGVPVIGYTWFPMTSMIDWNYRFGTRPVEDYRMELGLYMQSDTDAAQRWVETPLVAEFRDAIRDTRASVGDVAGIEPDHHHQHVVPERTVEVT